MRWTEGYIHVGMRSVLRAKGWELIAGEYPGGSDHELYPLNVVDPAVARDRSPDPRRHSQGELIPDLVALKDRTLLLAEAKPRYNEPDRLKLLNLVTARRDHLIAALRKFAVERARLNLLPVEELTFAPTLVFSATAKAPQPDGAVSYLRMETLSDGYFEGPLARTEHE